MDRFWKWLMKMDARGIFIMSLVALLGVTAWGVIDIFVLQHEDAAKAEELASGRVANPKLDPYLPIGVMDFVDSQFASETLVVPINPFHPTFEELIRHVTSIGGTNVVVMTTRDGRKFILPANSEGQASGSASPGPGITGGQPGTGPVRAGQPHFGQHQAGTGFQQQGKGAQGFKLVPSPQKKIRYVSFGGFLERPDGNFAPYVNSTVGGGRFLVKGDFYNGAVVTYSGKDGVEFEFSNGKKIKVVPGGEPQAFTLDTEENK